MTSTTVGMYGQPHLLMDSEDGQTLTLKGVVMAKQRLYLTLAEWSINVKFSITVMLLLYLFYLLI